MLFFHGEYLTSFLQLVTMCNFMIAWTSAALALGIASMGWHQLARYRAHQAAVRQSVLDMWSMDRIDYTQRSVSEFDRYGVWDFGYESYA